MFNTVKLWLVAARFWIIAACVAAALAFVGTQQWRIHTLRTELAESKAEVEKAGRHIDSLKAAVAMQNQAIDAWQAEAARRSKAAQDAIKQASQFRASSERKARVIYSIVPKGDECEDLRTIIDIARADGL